MSPQRQCNDMIGVLSHGVAAIPHLDSLLREPWTRLSWWQGPARGVDRIAGWGMRRSARRARLWARSRGLPYLALEDGFLRSVRLGHLDPPLSMVADDVGIYFDARAPSRLEHLIKGKKCPAQLQRAERLIAAWREAHVSKYNHAREHEVTQAPHVEPYVVVVDQTRGDPAIQAGLASAQDFARMLEAALDEQPRSDILLKLHPEVLARRKRGHFESLTRAQSARVTVLRQDLHPAGLLERARGVYTVTSQLGLEGLLWAKPVRTFGVPFYAGWGLTQDERARPDRRSPVTLGNLVHASLVEYMHCIDPETGQPCEVERLLAHLCLQRSMRARFAAQLYAVGLPYWKRSIVRSFFAGSQVRFVRDAGDAPAAATLIVWGAGHCASLAGHSVIRLEDGFLRSVGLGADLIRPLSWTMDRTGIHYDPTQPSDLESLLANTQFDAVLLRRAASLRDQLRLNRVTKYNLDLPCPEGHSQWKAPTHARVILVPGQVEDDASLRYGAHIRTNIELLQAVRASSPDAYIIYKPHPDVVAGLRRGDRVPKAGSLLCDEIAATTPLDELFDAVDEVHVICSLTGFEALIRGLRVVTHGCPFYAGWGLTTDHVPAPRRHRALTLNELIAGALILYPAYVSRSSGQYTTVERIVHELVQWRSSEQASTPSSPPRPGAVLQRLRHRLLQLAAARRRLPWLTAR